MRRIALIAAVVLSLAGAPAHGQLGAQAGGLRGFDPNAPTHDIGGSVINAATGEPIANALVQVMGVFQRADLSDSQGNFHFEGVPEGQAVFMARKPGFFSPEEMARGGGRPRPPVRISSNTGPIVLKLFPEGIVTGTITGDDGEPLEHVRVRVKRRVVINGRAQWEERSPASTNEDGEFRVANLVPGTYYLVAEVEGPRSPRAASEATGYPPTYYPGAPDLSSGAAIEVRGGQTTQLDFRLRSQPMYEISGTVIGLPAGQRGVGVQFSTRSGDNVGANFRFNPDDATFSVRLPAGTYTARASAFEPPNRRLGASVNFTAGKGANRITLVLQPGPSIPIAVRTEFTKQQSSSSPAGGMTNAASYRNLSGYADVQLIAVDNARASAYSTMQGGPDNPSFAVRDIEPGRYSVQVRPHGPWYVQSATCGQTDLLREELVVTPGGEARPIEIVLRDDGGSLNGSVMSDNVAVNAIVLAVPERNSTLPQPMYTSENGFNINMLAPGDYLLFAFDSTDGLEYSNRDALQPYVSRATRVTVSSNGSAKVTLTLIKRGES